MEREADRPAALNINVGSAIVFQEEQLWRLDDRDYLFGTPPSPPLPRRQLIDNA